MADKDKEKEPEQEDSEQFRYWADRTYVDYKGKSTRMTDVPAADRGPFLEALGMTGLGMPAEAKAPAKK